MTRADSASVVVGIDDSQTSVRAAMWAANIADQMNAPMVLATAVMIPGYYLPDVAAVTDDPQAETKAAHRRLDEVRREILSAFPELVVHTVAWAGPAHQVLVELSREAQLLVVGAHGTASIDSVLVGSVASLVANHATCPVVVWRRGRGSGPILVGVDGSPLSALAIEHAFDLASWFDTGVEAVHVWTPILGSEGAANPAEHRALLAESLAGWTEKYPDVPVEQIVATGDAAEVLGSLAKHARLVVVGSHGRGRVASTVLGSVSRHLIAHGTSPVMVCRGPNRQTG